jgi:DNA (cytosine-5)-methyltransferase 1
MLRVGTDCSGLDAVHEALTQMHVEFEYKFASDICPLVRKLLKQFPNRPHKIYHNLMERDPSQTPQVDLYVAGFPCQSFSTFGKRGGFATSDVFTGVTEYIATNRPRAFLLENVVSLLTHDKGETWKHVQGRLASIGGYTIFHKVMSPHEYGWPQSRARVFIVGLSHAADRFVWPEYRPIIRPLDSFLHPQATALEVYPTCARPLSTSAQKTFNVLETKAETRGIDLSKSCHIVRVGTSVGRERFGEVGICPCLTASGTHQLYIPILQRYLCPTESLQLQGFSGDHVATRMTTSYQLFKLVGNSIHVGLLRKVLHSIIHTFNQIPPEN